MPTLREMRGPKEPDDPMRYSPPGALFESAIGTTRGLLGVAKRRGDKPEVLRLQARMTWLIRRRGAFFRQIIAEGYNVKTREG